MKNTHLDSHLENIFLSQIRRNELVHVILERSEQLKIPNWYFGAGFIAQSIWNLNHGFSINSHIKDIDWVYFDPTDSSEESETAISRKISETFHDLKIPFDVKNQARVHLWYESKFGYPIEPYTSVEDAIETWPTTSTAIAMTIKNQSPSVFVPFGFSDLMSLTIRANKKQITEEIYKSKNTRWKQCWPKLQIIDWDKS